MTTPGREDVKPWFNHRNVNRRATSAAVVTSSDDRKMTTATDKLDAGRKKAQILKTQPTAESTILNQRQHRKITRVNCKNQQNV